MITCERRDHRYSVAAREEFFRTVTGTGNGTGVFLNTCNRVELYAGSGMPEPETVRHLFRVVSGLESRFVGETAIQSQVKRAYLAAANGRAVPVGIHKLFQAALRVGKRVRSETRISRGALSHSQAAVDVLISEGVDLEKAVIMIIGVHHLNRSIVRYLVRKGARTVFLGNRTYARAREMAAQLGCEAFGLEYLPERLRDADVLISATTAPHIVVRYDAFPRGKKMHIVDLAVPRDVDERIGNLPGVVLLNSEEIERRIRDTVRQRTGEIAKAEQIIQDEVASFFDRGVSV